MAAAMAGGKGRKKVRKCTPAVYTWYRAVHRSMVSLVKRGRGAPRESRRLTSERESAGRTSSHEGLEMGGKFETPAQIAVAYFFIICLVHMRVPQYQ